MHKRPYERLIAWQEAYRLCLWIYGITKKFPTCERYALVSQMRRSAYSAPMNIAEGNAKHSNKEKQRFFEIGLCSLEELHCQVHLAFDLQYITEIQRKKTNEHIARVSYLLTKLRAAFS